MHQCRLCGGASLSFGLMKADVNISSAINQFGFCEHLLLERFLSSLIIHLFRVLKRYRQGNECARMNLNNQQDDA